MTALLIIVIVILAITVLILAFKLRSPKYDGNMVVYDTDEKTTFSLEIATPPEKMRTQKSITLKVTDAPE